MRTLSTFILLIILALAYVPAPRAQEMSSTQEKKKRQCGTTGSTEQLEFELNRMERDRKNRELNLEAQAQDPPVDAPYYLPMTIHIVRRGNETEGFTLERLNRAMADLNRLWQPTGVQFFVYGNIDYINSYTHFDLPGGDSNADKAARDALREVNVVANTINVYFTNLGGDLAGESSYSTAPIQGVLMNNNNAGVDGDPSTFAHEVGHYFDLYHTHSDWRDKNGNLIRIECPNGSNCSTAGDLLCDTPADPDLTGRVDNNCAYNNSAMTPAGCDSTPYNPPTRNVMSYSPPPCSTLFTGDQIKKVLRVLRETDNRKNLIIKGARYVDPLASSTNADCTYDFPCHTVPKAIQLALSGDFIFIKPGVNQVSSLKGKQVTLNRWGTAGVAQITR